MPFRRRPWVANKPCLPQPCLVLCRNGPMDLVAVERLGEVILDYLLVGPVFPFLYFGHVLYVFNTYKPLLKDQPWLLSLVICLVHLNFGGTLRAILLGFRPGYLENNIVVPLAVGLWYHPAT